MQLFNNLNSTDDIKVYSFVGPSGTGKSYRAQMVAKENNVNTVYYIDDFYYMRPDKNDNPKHKKEYNELVKILGEDIVEMHNDENEFDIIRVPLVLFVKNGKLVDYHKGTYEGHVLKEKIDKNGKTVKYLEDLTEKQKKELKKVLTKKIKKVYEGQCTNKNGC